MREFDPTITELLLERQRSARRTLILTDSDVRSLIGIEDCLGLQAKTLVTHSANASRSVARTVFGPTAAGVRAALMPAYEPSYRMLSSKFLTNAPHNRQRGLPRNMSTLTLLDHETGVPLAIMSGTYLTNLRTATTAVLALTTLAVKGATHAGIYGSGPIARLALEALIATLPISTAVVYSPTAAHRTAFALAFDGVAGVRVRAATGPSEPLAADIVVAATDGSGPVFEAATLPRGSTVASVASRATRCEIPREVLGDAFVVVDDRDNALHEAGEFVLSRRDDAQADVAIHAELGEILDGRRPGRQGDDERWIFKSTGIALQDLVTASTVLVRALHRGVGSNIDLTS